MALDLNVKTCLSPFPTGANKGAGGFSSAKPTITGGQSLAVSPSATVSKTGPNGKFNPLLYAVGVVNFGRSGVKISTAAGFLGLSVVTVPCPETWWADPVLLGGGLWNAAGGLALAHRGTDEMLESAAGNTPGPEWQNLLGLLPFGGNFDTSAKASTAVSNIENSSVGTWISEAASGW